ncbi:MAG: hypothetical protein ACKVOU_03550 [Cytophagales bacterium]
MITKKEHIEFWMNIADKNWETALFNYNGKQFAMTLFMFNLEVEKLIEAH